ncbi:MAG TPA: M4 family metallopeptidase [Ktedonobacterales bacterium]
MTSHQCCTETRCTIIPPHILNELIRNGRPGQSNAALATLNLDFSMRTLRALRSAQPRPNVVGEVEQVTTSIYDTHNTLKLPGDLVAQAPTIAQTPTTGDAAADAAFDNLRATYTFYLSQYQWRSIDDHGMPLLATVHYGEGYDNAYWNGTQMVFGDGGGEIFQNFSASLDVVGHELTHGVTEFTAGLVYMDQAGALNESLSDVFGSLIKQQQRGQTVEQADWLIGADVLTPQVQLMDTAPSKPAALRWLKAPGQAYDNPLMGKDPQPAHMDNYDFTKFDNGGVHINSGIPNRAFYLAATNLGGYAWERAGLIWFTAMPQAGRLCTFAQFAALTTQAAAALYPGSPEIQQAVADAWSEVGVPTRAGMTNR